MFYCLDTSVIVDILRGDKNILSKLKEFVNKGSIFGITSITMAELYKGAFLAKRQDEAIRLVDEFVQSIEVLDFSKEACKIFGKKYLELKESGKQTQESDLMIASIALASNSIIITRNTKHFENISGLKILTW